MNTLTTIIPPKTDENDLHQPSLNYLSKIDRPFVEAVRENIEEEESILGVVFNKEADQIKDLKGKNLVLKRKVNRLDPGNPIVKDRGSVKIEGEVTDAQNNELLLKFIHEQTSVRGKSKSVEEFLKKEFEETFNAATSWNAKDISELLKKFK